jgi:type I restriction enzyme S subunit
LDEQAAIVRFLDHANRKIDGFIRAKRKLIGLLNEQKQAIIHRAVTRGLHPDVPLKPSGIPWLGDIPKHWEVKPLKYLSRQIQNGATPPSDSPHYFENGTIPWFGPTSISSSVLVGAPAKHITTHAVRDGKARLIKSPALLVVVIGTVGKMALLATDGATNQQITAFELRAELAVPELLTLQLKFAEPWLNAAASSSTIPILDSVLLKRTPTALPPLKEQNEILDLVSQQTAPYDTAIARTEREIALMQEYRTRLTADLVTGKLDVRAAAAKLPESAAEEAQRDELAEVDEEEVEVEG